MALKTKYFFNNYKSCSCCMPGVWRSVAYAKGFVVIFHSPQACGHVARMLDINSGYRELASLQQGETVPLLTTQIGEREAIFGGSEALEDCIAYAVKNYQPKAIVIATSCVAGVIGDDVEGVAKMAEAEYGLPVLSIDSSGFLDGEYYEGYYAMTDKIVERFLGPEPREQGSVILLGDQGGPWGSYGQEVRRLLAALKLKVRGQFPSFLPFDELQQVAKAEYSLILGSRNMVPQGLLDLAAKLEKQLGVKQGPALYPIGWQNTLAWLQELGRIFNRQELAKQVVEQERSLYLSKLQHLLPHTHGRKVVLCIGRYVEYFQPQGMLEIIAALELELLGVILLDGYTEAGYKDMAAAVARHTAAPIFNAAQGEALLDQANLVLTTHQLQQNVRQLFIPMLPKAGTMGELELLEAIARSLASKRPRGGISYV